MGPLNYMTILHNSPGMKNFSLASKSLHDLTPLSLSNLTIYYSCIIEYYFLLLMLQIISLNIPSCFKSLDLTCCSSCLECTSSAGWKYAQLFRTCLNTWSLSLMPQHSTLLPPLYSHNLHPSVTVFTITSSHPRMISSLWALQEQ